MFIIFLIIFVVIISLGMNELEEQSKSKKECSYHHWEFKKPNGDRLECSICGKIVSNED